MGFIRKLGLGVVIAVALVLRVWLLDTVPNGFHVDELDAGYIGRYIIQNGRDITGHVLPLYYDKFGDFRPTGIFYLSGLSVGLFGSTPFAVRLPAALLGAATAAAVYLLAKRLYGNTVAALAAALAVAVSPWHIVLSRATSEGIAGLFFLVAGLAVAVSGLGRNLIRRTAIGILLMLASYMFYHPFRIVTPAVIALLIFHPTLTRIQRRTVLAGAVAGVLLTMLLSLTSAGTGRLSQVAFYTNPLMTSKSDVLLSSEGAGHTIRARLFHNKGIIFAREFTVQYLKYFSPEYLFVNGGLPYRYVVPEQGLLPIVALPLVLLGIYGLSRRRDHWPLVATALLLALAPVPAALTYEDTPNIHRSLIMIIPMALLAGAGVGTLAGILTRIRVRFAVYSVLAAILVVETVYFWHEYTTHSPSAKPFYRQDGYIEAARLIASTKDKADGIYVTGYEHMPLYVLFASGDYSLRAFTGKSNDVLIDRIGDIHFFHSWCPDPAEVGTGDAVLIVAGGDCAAPRTSASSEWKTDKIMRKDSTAAFAVSTKTPVPVSGGQDAR